MRIVIVGGGSFIARHVAQASTNRGVDWLAVSHSAVLDNLGREDVVINFALQPEYRWGPYMECQDQDLRAAKAAAEAGARFIMLSSRRVYRSDSRWDALEEIGAEGDETPYGKNKARSEKAILEATSGLAGIFRLPNVFGFEYARHHQRQSFLSLLLARLKESGTIVFDMSSNTRRDFLPVDICAELIVDRAREGTAGIFNLGSGIAITCGDLARWVLQGYGKGKLSCESPQVKDEFFLNMNRWRQKFELPVNVHIIQDYCIQLGRRLTCAEL